MADSKTDKPIVTFTAIQVNLLGTYRDWCFRFVGTTTDLTIAMAFVCLKSDGKVIRARGDFCCGLLTIQRST